MTERLFRLAFAAFVLLAQAVPAAAAPRTADFIAAVVNQELVTAVEVEQRVAQVRANAQRQNQRVPADAELRRQVLNALIEERAVLSHARETSSKVDGPELDRAVASVAAQNQLTLPQLRERLARDGMDYARFRDNLRDQLLMERVREREVTSRIIVTDSEIDSFLARERAGATTGRELNIAQLLIEVPDGASDAVVAERRARAEAAQARVRGGEDFAKVARELSQDANKERGGEIGLRPVDRLPEVFVAAVQGLKPGEVAPTLLRTGAGFHLLKLVEQREGGAFRITQTRSRHILLRPSAQAGAEAAARQLSEFKRLIQAGTRRFEDLARERSEDQGSGERGGELGWTSPGAFVPEFEEAMNKLPINGISDPVQSRFGLHLIQVLERREVALDPKQLREQARTALREQKFEQAYTDWVRDLRARAYVEVREAPQ
jgi:peptidyl-prolyl cis-trans isomerase SurA